MMREIKFRAWNENEKKMVTPCMWINECNLITSQMCSTPTHPIMQFTGLKDRKEVDIYERDILRDERQGVLWLVSFNEGSFIAGDPKNPLDFVFIDDLDFEIIGNIHQNPELLES